MKRPVQLRSAIHALWLGMYAEIRRDYRRIKYMLRMREGRER